MKLYICEKDTQVKPLTKALIKAGIKDFKVVALSGHILRPLEPKEYPNGIKNWQEAVLDKKLPFVPDRWLYTINDKVKSQIARNKRKFDEIKKYIKQADEVYIVTDPDPEGARLGEEVVEKLKETQKIKGMINISDPTLSALVREVKNPSITNWRELAKAAFGRMKGDWILGNNATVAATILLGDYIKEDNGKINVGPVKSVVMKMVVDRDLQYENFKAVPFWFIKGSGVKDNSEFPLEFLFKINDKWEKRFDKKNLAEKFLEELKQNPYGVVMKTKESQKRTAPPKPLSKTDIQVLASKLLGFNLKKTADTLQSLYEGKHGGKGEGYITYPRTDERVYSLEEYKMVFPELINSLKEHYSFLNNLNPNNLVFRKDRYFDPVKKKKTLPHYALRPTTRSDLELLSPDEKKLYEIILVYWAVQLFPDYVYKNKTVEILSKANDKILAKTSSNETISPGWKEIMVKIQKINYREKDTLPDMKKGDEIKFKDLSLGKGETKPKPRFTQTSLAKAMENIAELYDDPEIKKELKEAGIGTSATRDIHILNLIKEGYLKEVKQGKTTYLVSTPKTRKIVEILPPDLLNPILRAKMENFMNQAREGKISDKDIEKYFIELTKKYIKEMEKIREKKNLKLNIKDSKMQDTGLTCPLCGGAVIEREKAFVCENQKWNPQTKQTEGCPFIIWKGPSKVFDKKLTTDDVRTLLEGGEVKDSQGNKMVLDTNSQYFTKIVFAPKQNGKETNVVCPLCKKGKIVITDKVAKCSEAKWDREKQENIGCKFVIFRNQKLFGKKLTEKDIENLIKKGEIKNKDKKLILDLNNQYFTRVEFLKK